MQFGKLINYNMRDIFLEKHGCPDCDVINFVINLNPLIKPFFYITKKSRQNRKYLKNEKIF